MSTKQLEGEPVFVPKPEHQPMFSSLDTILQQLQDHGLSDENKAALQTQANAIQAKIAIMGDSVGEFEYS